MANVAKSDLTVHQLRAMDYEYAAQFAQLVAACVDDIVEQSDDAEVIDRAYQWRMWAAPQARAAAFDQDPFAGVLELWVLAKQQHDYFTEGRGKGSFGEHQGFALETTRFLEDEVELLASNIVSEDDWTQLSDSVYEWVEAHPIEGQLYVRPTARADLAGLVSEVHQGGLKAVGSMQQTLRDLTDRMTILTVQMPVEARWQVDYLTRSLFEEKIQEPVIKTTESIATFLEGFEGSLADQTATLVDGIERERLAIFDAVEAERTDIIAAVEAERAEIIAAVEKERISILEQLDEQVTAAMARLDTMGRGLIDHFFIRLIQVLAVVGVVTILTVVLLLVMLRKRDRAND